MKAAAAGDRPYFDYISSNPLRCARAGIVAPVPVPGYSPALVTSSLLSVGHRVQPDGERSEEVSKNVLRTLA